VAHVQLVSGLISFSGNVHNAWSVDVLLRTIRHLPRTKSIDVMACSKKNAQRAHIAVCLLCRSVISTDIELWCITNGCIAK
jgi:Mg2+/Co2+ transporter CorC